MFAGNNLGGGGSNLRANDLAAGASPSSQVQEIDPAGVLPATAI